MQSQITTCPECGYDFLKNPQTSIYGHAVSCFNLDGRGAKRDLDNIKSERRRSAEHVSRASILLQAVIEAEK